jgi:hypothetical protein
MSRGRLRRVLLRRRWLRLTHTADKRYCLCRDAHSRRIVIDVVGLVVVVQGAPAALVPLLPGGRGDQALVLCEHSRRLVVHGRHDVAAAAAVAVAAVGGCNGDRGVRGRRRC